MDQMLMAHPGIYSKAFAQGSSHAAKWKVVGVRQDRLYIYVSAWFGMSFCASACWLCMCVMACWLCIHCMQPAKDRCTSQRVPET